jgi:hypothetical protein
MTQLGDALFSNAQQPILALLYGRPEQWFHVKELIRLTGLGSAGVQRELARLEKGELIETRRIGNLKQVRAFADSPIFSELRLVVMKTFGAAEVLREPLVPLASGINFAFVHGSVAPEKTISESNDPLAAAHMRGRRFSLEQYECPDNLTLLDARDVAGRNERSINEERQKGELYALLPPGKTRGFRYPKWQFDASSERLKSVLRPFVDANANCWVSTRS